MKIRIVDKDFDDVIVKISSSAKLEFKLKFKYDVPTMMPIKPMK
jgi:hypothetical protein